MSKAASRCIIKSEATSSEVWSAVGGEEKYLGGKTIDIEADGGKQHLHELNARVVIQLAQRPKDCGDLQRLQLLHHFLNASLDNKAELLVKRVRVHCNCQESGKIGHPEQQETRETMTLFCLPQIQKCP